MADVLMNSDLSLFCSCHTILRKEKMGEPFTSAMRRATKNVHSISDRLVNSKLLLVINDETVWSDALLVFYEVFKCLELYKREMAMPQLDKLYVDDVLLRTAAFEKDLNRYLGAGWKKNYTVRPQVVEYIQHLQELRDERPLLLLAYVYHLYMGLLSGGQIIKKKRQIKESLPIFSFFTTDYSNGVRETDWAVEFPNRDIKELKLKMKKAMNEIAAALTQEQRYALTNESQMVFIYNNTIVKSVCGTNKAILLKVMYAIAIVNVLVIGYFYFK